MLCALPRTAAQQTDKPLVFRNVDVFDGSRLIRNTTVLVRDGMVRAVSPEVQIPSSAYIIDGKGKTLLPGLIDAHVHLGIALGEQFLRDALSFGVTTELEMWGSDASLALRNKVTSGDPSLPVTFCPGLFPRPSTSDLCPLPFALSSARS